MSINKEKLELFKSRYKKEWEEFKFLENGEKLFYQLCNAKEKQIKIRKEKKKMKEKEKKREARALIIFAKLLLRTMDKERTRTFLEQYRGHFIQKERNKLIDYSTYIYKILEEME